MMIKVVLKKSDQYLYAFEISGHADSGPYGYDLVCAGVSAVTFGTVNALIEIGSVQPFIEQAEDGYLYVELSPASSKQKEAQTILQAMVVSLETIEREYKQHIQIMES